MIINIPNDVLEERENLGEVKASPIFVSNDSETQPIITIQKVNKVTPEVTYKPKKESCSFWWILLLVILYFLQRKEKNQKI